MSRLKLRWALTRVSLVMCILLAVQFFSQLGLLTTRGPDCEQIRVVKERVGVQANPEGSIEQVVSVKTEAVITQIPEVKQDMPDSNIKNSQKLIDDLKRIAVELSEAQRGLVSYAVHYHRIGKQIESLNSVIKSLGGETVQKDRSSNVDKSLSAPKKEVCPEEFMGKTLAYGYPYFRKGFQRQNCTEYVPIDELVTVIAILPDELSAKNQFQVFKGIAKYYPNIRIASASKEKLPIDVLTKLKLNLKNIVTKELTHGETWSKLLQEVTTPYVLFAPDITHFTDDVDLERLVRVLSDNNDAIIAGGSHRNLRGEWDIGCLQVTFRNWTVFFRGGYYHSFTECIVCDVLSGPFVAKTEGVRQVGLDKK